MGRRLVAASRGAACEPSEGLCAARGVALTSFLTGTMRSMPSSTFVMSYTRRLRTPSLVAASFRSKGCMPAAFRSSRNWMVRLYRDESDFSRCRRMGGRAGLAAATASAGLDRFAAGLSRSTASSAPSADVGIERAGIEVARPRRWWRERKARRRPGLCALLVVVICAASLTTGALVLWVVHDAAPARKARVARPSGESRSAETLAARPTHSRRSSRGLALAVEHHAANMPARLQYELEL